MPQPPLFGRHVARSDSEYIHTFFSAIGPLKLFEERSASQSSATISFNLLIAVATHYSSTEVLGSSSELLGTTRIASALELIGEGLGDLHR